jgi:membrane protease YdiL (CAAX protease family)
VEIIFRGLAHGLLGAHHPMQQPGGRWFVSLPVAASALLYAAAAGLWGGAPVVLAGWLPALAPAAPVPLAGALVFGLAAGLVRERSESVVTPILLHALCAALVLAAAS